MAKKILVVDDSISMRQIISIILSEAGYQAVLAADGAEGLEKLDDQIELILCDYNMPNMNGVEFITQVRHGKINPAVPIVMVTTESENTRKQEGKAAGATAWLTKPVEKESLLQVVSKITRTLEF
ncbi:two-component system, chemotaxis family, response regulator CheY [Alkalispirochaeta americana]|uniref:Two-component system, chemotaxis family, response regulator CheY n=1 Tax=Alkalispirochaeta americana TaxID=159291 RepID=A0A1N6UUR0_9SPIO|nr:response regulator [Alkalispirochaeta americana]SIQ69363.1 two-component system, chemotaxis family, response regulator CheY [Alkalispirochaeta americana]